MVQSNCIPSTLVIRILIISQAQSIVPMPITDHHIIVFPVLTQFGFTPERSINTPPIVIIRPTMGAAKFQSKNLNILNSIIKKCCNWHGHITRILSPTFSTLTPQGTSPGPLVTKVVISAATAGSMSRFGPVTAPLEFTYWHSAAA